MAGSLIKINEVIASSSATITLTGINTTYNVYQVVASNIVPASDSQALRIRVGTGGTPDSDSEYDMTFKVFESNSGISNHAEVNQTSWRGVTYGTGTNEAGNLLINCFNFSNASNFSYITLEENTFTNSAHLASFTGGAVHSVNEANDSISFHMASGNIASGTFSLYALKN
tara:strand:+ start:69 stop:581 length:513 start_codon:yes stop_codon:yes gene_type:complete